MKPGTPWFASIALLLTAAQVPAATPRLQEHEQEPAPAPAATPTTSETKLQELVERYNKKRNEVIQAYRKTEDEDEREVILADMPGESWAPEFRAIAEEAHGTDTAVSAWIWVLRLTESDTAKAWEVVETLLADSMQSPALAELTGELRYASYEHGEPKVIGALTAIVEHSPVETVRAGALYALGGVRLDSSDPTIHAAGRECFETLVRDYGALPYRGKSTYKAAAESFLFELDHLQLGMAAPDFEATDENGVSWKLSDYRGKVVVVDFWGNW